MKKVGNESHCNAAQSCFMLTMFCISSAALDRALDRSNPAPDLVEPNVVRDDSPGVNEEEAVTPNVRTFSQNIHRREFESDR